jgi:hypothetical protein
MGDVADPQIGESIWAWNDRTKNYYPNKRNPTDMTRIWSSCLMVPNAMDKIRNSEEWQSHQNNNEHIMTWCDLVFFSDDGELAMFKLQFHEHIEAMRILVRQTFKYVNR